MPAVGKFYLNFTRTTIIQGRWPCSNFLILELTKFIINQKGKKLTIERFGTSQDGENYTYTEKYTLDGKKCENIVFETTKKKSTAN